MSRPYESSSFVWFPITLSFSQSVTWSHCRQDLWWKFSQDRVTFFGLGVVVDHVWNFFRGCVLLGKYPCVRPRTPVDWWRDCGQRRRNFTHSLPGWWSLYNGAGATDRCQPQRGTHTHTHNHFTALWILSGTTRMSWYQKKHSPTHVCLHF